MKYLEVKIQRGKLLRGYKTMKKVRVIYLGIKMQHVWWE